MRRPKSFFANICAILLFFIHSTHVLARVATLSNPSETRKETLHIATTYAYTERSTPTVNYLNEKDQENRRSKARLIKRKKRPWDEFQDFVQFSDSEDEDLGETGSSETSATEEQEPTTTEQKTSTTLGHESSKQIKDPDRGEPPQKRPKTSGDDGNEQLLFDLAHAQGVESERIEEEFGGSWSLSDPEIPKLPADLTFQVNENPVLFNVPSLEIAGLSNIQKHGKSYRQHTLQSKASRNLYVAYISTQDKHVGIFFATKPLEDRAFLMLLFLWQKASETRPKEKVKTLPEHITLMQVENQDTNSVFMQVYKKLLPKSDPFKQICILKQEDGRRNSELRAFWTALRGTAEVNAVVKMLYTFPMYFRGAQIREIRFYFLQHGGKDKLIAFLNLELSAETSWLLDSEYEGGSETEENSEIYTGRDAGGDVGGDIGKETGSGEDDEGGENGQTIEEIHFNNCIQRAEAQRVEATRRANENTKDDEIDQYWPTELKSHWNARRPNHRILNYRQRFSLVAEHLDPEALEENPYSYKIFSLAYEFKVDNPASASKSWGSFDLAVSDPNQHLVLYLPPIHAEIDGKVSQAIYDAWQTLGSSLDDSDFSPLRYITVLEAGNSETAGTLLHILSEINQPQQPLSSSSIDEIKVGRLLYPDEESPFMGCWNALLGTRPVDKVITMLYSFRHALQGAQISEIRYFMRKRDDRRAENAAGGHVWDIGFLLLLSTPEVDTDGDTDQASSEWGSLITDPVSPSMNIENLVLFEASIQQLEYHPALPAIQRSTYQSTNEPSYLKTFWKGAGNEIWVFYISAIEQHIAILDPTGGEIVQYGSGIAEMLIQIWDSYTGGNRLLNRITFLDFRDPKRAAYYDKLWHKLGGSGDLVSLLPMDPRIPNFSKIRSEFSRRREATILRALCDHFGTSEKHSTIEVGRYRAPSIIALPGTILSPGELSLYIMMTLRKPVTREAKYPENLSLQDNTQSAYVERGLAMIVASESLTYMIRYSKLWQYDNMWNIDLQNQFKFSERNLHKASFIIQEACNFIFALRHKLESMDIDIPRNICDSNDIVPQSAGFKLYTIVDVQEQRTTDSVTQFGISAEHGHVIVAQLAADIRTSSLADKLYALWLKYGDKGSQKVTPHVGINMVSFLQTTPATKRLLLNLFTPTSSQESLLTFRNPEVSRLSNILRSETLKQQLHLRSDRQIWCMLLGTPELGALERVYVNLGSYMDVDHSNRKIMEIDAIHLQWNFKAGHEPNPAIFVQLQEREVLNQTPKYGEAFERTLSNDRIGLAAQNGYLLSMSAVLQTGLTIEHAGDYFGLHRGFYEVQILEPYIACPTIHIAWSPQQSPKDPSLKPLCSKVLVRSRISAEQYVFFISQVSGHVILASRTEVELPIDTPKGRTDHLSAVYAEVLRLMRAPPKLFSILMVGEHSLQLFEYASGHKCSRNKQNRNKSMNWKVTRAMGAGIEGEHDRRPPMQCHWILLLAMPEIGGIERMLSRGIASSDGIRRTIQSINWRQTDYGKSSINIEIASIYQSPQV